MTNTRGRMIAAGMLGLAITACSSTPETKGSRLDTRKPTGTAGSSAGVKPGAATGAWSSTSSGSGAFVPTNTAPTGAAGVAPLKEGQCAGGDIPVRRQTPTVWLVLDGSGSMNTALEPNVSRWMALKAALMDPTNGVVKTLEHDIHWGMVMYDGPLPFGTPPTPLLDGGMPATPAATECPRLVIVPPMADNFTAIDAAYPVDPLGGSTPTNLAIDAVLQQIPNAGQAQLDSFVEPAIIVLATDGEPNNFCEGGSPFDDVASKVVASVTQLATLDIQTYVISLAGMDQRLTDHLTAVAAAGKTGKAPFIPTSKDELLQTFRDIIGPPRVCDIALRGEIVMGNECMGTFEVNGQPLPCNDPNGWALKDAHTITLQGAACMKYMEDPEVYLHADFPCEAIAVN